MHPPLPFSADVRTRDAEHLKLIAIFHFVVAGLALVGLQFLAAHYAVMSHVIDNPEFTKAAKNPPPPQLFKFLYLFYGLMGGLLVTAALGNVLSGWFILRRRYRIFSLIIAGLNCLHFPFGTTLGVFTFIVLLRDSVSPLYEEAPPRLPL